MKILKKLPLLLVFTLIISLFSGCTKEDKALLDAIIKSQEILSMESTTDLSFYLSGSGLSEEEQASFDSVAKILNDLTVIMKQKSQVNKEQTKVKGQVDANIKLTDMSFDSAVWVDMDMSSEKPVFKEIIKLPSLLTASMPEPINGKEYFVLDFDTMNETYANMGMPVDYNKTMAIAMKYQEKFVNAFKEYIKNFDSNVSTVTKLEDKVINGELCNVYQIKFDDASFKEFLEYSIISLLKDEEILPLFKDYMNEVMGIYGEEMPEELDFTKDIPELITKINEFFKAFKEFNILGKDGITIKYGINKDGFIISEEGTFDFIIDTQKFIDLFSKLSGEEQVLEAESTPIFNFGLSYNTQITSINKDIEVTIPALTEENSVDFETLMASMMPAPESIPFTIIAEDNFLELSSEPLIINNRIYIPARDISKAIDAKVEWNQSAKEVTISKNDLKLIFKADSNIAYKNNEELVLDSKITIINGTAFIPLRFISESFEYNVNWNSQGRIIIINK